MALSMKQAMVLNGMGAFGYIEAIAAIVGPLVGGAADIYKTSSDSSQNRKELKQREREFKAMIPLQQQAQKLSALDTIAAVRQQQIVSGASAQFAPYMLGMAALGALALVAISTRGRRRG